MWNYSLKLIYRLVELAFTKILFDSFINSALSLFIKSFQWKSSNARIQASKSKRHEPVTDTHFRIFPSTEQFKGKNSPYWDRVFNLELPWRNVKAKQLGNFQVWAWVVLVWRPSALPQAMNSMTSMVTAKTMPSFVIWMRNRYRSNLQNLLSSIFRNNCMVYYARQTPSEKQTLTEFLIGFWPSWRLFGTAPKAKRLFRTDEDNDEVFKSIYAKISIHSPKVYFFYYNFVFFCFLGIIH